MRGAIGGASTGAIAAFTIAWEHPDGSAESSASGDEQCYVLVQRQSPNLCVSFNRMASITNGPAIIEALDKPSRTDTSEILKINASTLKIQARWPLAPANRTAQPAM